jgi:hypothetical protein
MLQQDYKLHSSSGFFSGEKARMETNKLELTVEQSRDSI